MATSAARKSPEQCWEEYSRFVTAFLERRIQTTLRRASKPIRQHYQKRLCSEVKEQFMNQIHTYDQREQIAPWLDEFIKWFVAQKLDPLMRGNEFVDEELVRLANAGFDEARVQLMERYAPKIKKTVTGIVYANNVSPPSQDAPSFIEDVTQNVSLKITANLASYRFEQPFEHWVATICNNEAYGERRDNVGRAEKGPRVYVSWKELQQHSPSTGVRKLEHLDILNKVFLAHRKQGVRAEKSADAIKLKWFQDLETEEIAAQLNTTTDYVYQLFSHDYRELRRISIDDFGVSGTDL